MAKTLEYKAQVKKDGRIIISKPEAGYTVVAVREGKRMIRFAAAWCSPTDKFKRGIGKDVAAQKFVNGETMVAPLAHHVDEDVIFYLTETFDTLAS